MSAGGARRGRRDNGLDAADFAVAGDVDPRVGEHLLDVLGAGGIAAYLQPSADLNPVTRTTTLPARPTDRLYVDRAHLDDRPRLPGPAGRRIPSPSRRRAHQRPRAGRRRRVGEDRRRLRHPGRRDRRALAGRREPADRPADPPAAPARRHRAGRPRRVRRLPSAADFSGVSVSPRRDRRRAVAARRAGHVRQRPAGRADRRRGLHPAAAAAAAPHLQVRGAGRARHRGRLRAVPLPGRCCRSTRRLVTVFGFLAILAGFVTLVCRLRPGDDDDDDPDDGAVV